MKTLIIKYGASGDVVRTTTLLNVLKGKVDWLTAPINVPLVKGLPGIVRVFTNEDITMLNKTEYDLVINLEDNLEAAQILNMVKHRELFGAYADKSGKLNYTDSSREWFDLSLISRHGLWKANILKYGNNKSFQELVFRGLGYEFHGEPYLLPKGPITNLYGDIAVSPKAGNVWPMKNWKFYDELVEYLRNHGFVVNYLPQRSTMLEHLSDVSNHRYLISGDSLPMHFALGSNVACLTLFICTSPSEIYGYGLQKKIISKDLQKYFYRRDYDPMAVRSISLEEVINAFTLLKSERVKYAVN